MRLSVSLLAALFVGPGILHAAIVDVFPTSPSALQDAINAASPGDTLRIHGGTYSSISVGKELDLIAEPQATVLGRSIPPTSPGFITLVPPIRMTGPGQGKVTFQNVRTDGFYDANIFGYSGPALPHVRITGFDEVRFYDCEIVGPFWSANGGVEGGAGIEADIPRLVLSGTTLRALNVDSSSQVPPAAPLPALLASDTVVIAVDCDIEGGRVAGLSSSQCPGSNYSRRLIGAPGVVCKQLLQTGGSIRGGPGQTFPCFGTPQKIPDGVGAIALEHIVQSENLRELEPPRLGQTWSLLSVVGESGGFLRVAFDIGPVEFNPTFGYNLVESAQVFTFANIPSLGGVTNFPVPNDPNLLGFELAAEVLDLGYARFGGAVLSQIR